MYQVIDKDGAAGEPVDLTTLKEMAGDGRLVPQTMVLDPVSGQTLAACDMFVHENLFTSEEAVTSAPEPEPVAATYAAPEPPPVSVPVMAAPVEPPPTVAPAEAPPYTPTYAPPPTQTYAPPPPTQTYAPPPPNQTYAPSAFPGLAAGEQKSKIAAGLLAIFLGGLGIHGFYIGNKKMALTILITNMCCFGLTIVTFGLLGLLLIPVMGLIGIGVFVQGILYLVASDAEFEQKYVVEQRWF